MKVLLLNPLYEAPLGQGRCRYFVRSGSRWPHSGVKALKATPHYLPFPFSLAYAAAYLKKSSIDVRVIDALALNLHLEQLLPEISRINPDLIFYELVTPTAEFDLELAQKIKQVCSGRIAVGGSHAAYFAQEILRDNKAVDFIIGPDYEHVLAQLAQRNGSGLSGLPVMYRLADGSAAGKINSGNKEGPQELIRPLQEIFPANDRADPTLYWDGFCQLRPCLQVQSSRGCRRGCSFCLGSAKNIKFQQAPIGQLCSQIQEACLNYGAREIYFDDDDFLDDFPRASAIFDELKARNVRIKWSAMSAFSSLDPQRIRQLASWGCIGLKLGVESASPRILEQMGKPLDADKAGKIIAACRKCGIKTHLTFIIGYLNENAGEIAQTAALSAKLDADSIQVSIATPFPGTEFYRQASQSGILKDAPWQDYDGKRKSVIHEKIGGKDLGRIRKEFLFGWSRRRLFSLPGIIRRFPVIWRTLCGTGPGFFIKQMAAVYTDENKNR